MYLWPRRLGLHKKSRHLWDLHCSKQRNCDAVPYGFLHAAAITLTPFLTGGRNFKLFSCFKFTPATVNAICLLNRIQDCLESLAVPSSAHRRVIVDIDRLRHSNRISNSRASLLGAFKFHPLMDHVRWNRLPQKKITASCSHLAFQ